MVHSSTIDQLINLTAGKFPNCSVYVHDGVITRELYESRKAERQGKPDWKDAPEWANWLAQDLTTGHWWFYDAKPMVMPAAFGVAFGRQISPCTGEVIGNWQDTLEQRPEVISDSQVTRRSYAKEHKAAFDKFADSVCSKMFGPEAYHNAKQLNELLSDAQTKPSMFEPWACLEIPAKADWYDYDKFTATRYPNRGVVAEVFYGPDNGTGRWVLCFVVGASDRDDLVLQHVGPEQNVNYLFCEHQLHKIRPTDWNRNQPKVEPVQSPELSFHLATAQNELTSSAKLLPAESNLLQSITGVIAAIQAIREVV